MPVGDKDAPIEALQTDPEKFKKRSLKGMLLGTASVAAAAAALMTGAVKMDNPLLKPIFEKAQTQVSTVLQNDPTSRPAPLLIAAPDQTCNTSFAHESHSSHSSHASHSSHSSHRSSAG